MTKSDTSIADTQQWFGNNGIYLSEGTLAIYLFSHCRRRICWSNSSLRVPFPLTVSHVQEGWIKGYSLLCKIGEVNLQVTLLIFRLQKHCIDGTSDVLILETHF